MLKKTALFLFDGFPNTDIYILYIANVTGNRNIAYAFDTDGDYVGWYSYSTLFGVVLTFYETCEQSDISSFSPACRNS